MNKEIAGYIEKGTDFITNLEKSLKKEKLMPPIAMNMAAMAAEYLLAALAAKLSLSVNHGGISPAMNVILSKHKIPEKYCKALKEIEDFTAICSATCSIGVATRTDVERLGAVVVEFRNWVVKEVVE